MDCVLPATAGIPSGMTITYRTAAAALLWAAACVNRPAAAPASAGPAAPVSAGAPAPDFTATAQDGSTVTLSSLRGKPVVLYFFPKADTPG